jgi:hypothetical protein
LREDLDRGTGALAAEAGPLDLNFPKRLVRKDIGGASVIMVWGGDSRVDPQTIKRKVRLYSDTLIDVWHE